MSPSTSYENVYLDGSARGRRRRLLRVDESTRNPTTGSRLGALRLLVSGPAQVLGWAALMASAYPWLWGKDGVPVFKLDAWVYYHAVAQWHTGGSLYDWYANPGEHLWPFTYPPFAAWALSPLTWGSDRAAQVIMVLATPVCTAATAWATMRALGAERRIALATAPWLALAGVLFLEPVYKTMEYGQVNAVLMALVAIDLLAVPEGSRWRGAGAGLAAAFKLTPAIAVLVLVVRREWRAAATMVGTAAGATALCWAIWPAESAQFFFSAMLDPSRAGFPEYAGNQNLKGASARWLPEQAWNPAWALAVVVVGLGAWLLLRRLTALAAALGGTGSPDAGLVLSLQVSTAMAAGLLISPISWSHHWVWCLPALMALATAAWRWYSPALATTALTGAAVFALAMQWWFPGQNHLEKEWPFAVTVVGSSYTWWALAAGTALWVVTGRLVRARAPQAPLSDAAPAGHERAPSPVRSARATFRRHPRR